MGKVLLSVLKSKKGKRDLLYLIIDKYDLFCKRTFAGFAV